MKTDLVFVKALGRMRHSQDRWIFEAPGRHLVVIVFEVSDIKIFDGCADGSVKNWTPLFYDRHAWDAAGALRHFGMEVAA